MEKKKFIQKTGRRKTSIARVRLVSGKGNIIVNDKPLKEYFYGIPGAEKIIKEPLVLIGEDGKYDISVKVTGGGKMSQIDATRMGLSRGLLEKDKTARTTLKKAGFLTRDARAKERKKYGLKRARKATQYRKR